MSITRPRRSTSAISYSESDAAPIRTSLNELRVLVTREEIEPGQYPVQDGIRLLQTLCNSLQHSSWPNKFQDVFRNLNGFQRITDVIHYAAVLSRQIEGSKDSHYKPFELLEAGLQLLTSALQNHRGNRRYFRNRPEAGGWPALQHGLKEYLQSLKDESTASQSSRLCGRLLACSLEDDSVGELFARPDTFRQEHSEILSNKQEKEAPAAREMIETILGSQKFLFNPEALCVLFDLWCEQHWEKLDGAISLLPTVLEVVVSSRTYNLVAANEAGLLSKSLAMLKNSSLSPAVLIGLQGLSNALLSIGISELNDAFLLYGSASSDPRIADILRQALKPSTGYPFIHFDLSLHGFASVELSDLGHVFPPPSSQSPGYTLSLWLQIIEFDSNSHTTIFGAFDSTQTCFVLVYLEKDTRNLILQTSVTSSRPSVRFKSFEFEAGKWYHVCLVHRRPGVTNTSRASLFVDGEFVEQAKAHFPSAPPAAPPTQRNNDSTSPGRRPGTVQCFLGTPQDLAPQTGRGISCSQWRLCSVCLLGDALSDDLIAVHKELGPRYYGNYQDCLGSFQTYEASASLNLRNETLHPGKEEKSIIVAAIRSKAGNVMPESKFLLSVSPASILDELDRSIWSQSHIISGLSKNAMKNLRHWAKGGRPSVLINGAIPSINRALTNTSGTCFLTGQPSVLVPQALDDASWRLGGSAPIGLAILEAADNDQEILKALDILFAMIQASWRNSEAMEKDNGFGILASLLSAKMAKANETKAFPIPSKARKDKTDESFKLSVLEKILHFVGYDPDCPENSVINNPLAYRILLVDLDIWRSASPEVQKLYYQQFTVFSIGSKHHMFNARRLARMRKPLNQ